MSSKILPCPFCGDNEYGELRRLARGFVCVQCDNCGAKGGVSDSEARAVEAWNRRATPSAPPVPDAIPEDIADILGYCLDFTYGRWKELSGTYLHYEENFVETKKRIDAAGAWLKRLEEKGK